MFVEKGPTHYPYAGSVGVFIDGNWGGICAADWDMNDAEVVCRELGFGYPYGITVVGGPPAGNGTECLSRVKCYGHEEHLSECKVTKRTRKNTTVESGIVCYPPASTYEKDDESTSSIVGSFDVDPDYDPSTYVGPGLRLRYGPDQYSGLVEVKLAGGSWSRLYLDYFDFWDFYQYILNICRQLGFGELNFWDSFEYSSTYRMTKVTRCAN
ncbi:deleted in malignant brain tumors 1 protein-like [Strongylocentrotus purpuratus]|uniref:SRCR domain-containing protein n=1 Tax=Strongylocentrotus purpuratus TaxID=7668 RepID=A0A7M7T075_STRPU|nr:deleted in malignant brain tumors 1 protein-like [Strongylocentrotus purpuratus]